MASRDQLKGGSSPQAVSSQTRRQSGGAEERRVEAGTAGKLLAQAEDRHAAAKTKLAQTLVLRDHQLEDLKQRQHHRLESAASLERAEKEFHFSSEHAERAEEHSSWLADIIGHCEKAESKKVFEGPVVGVFGEALSRLREAGELQRTQAQEAGVLRRKALVAKDTAARELGERDAHLAEARAAIARSEEESQVAQLNVDRYAQQAKHLRIAAQAEQEAFRLGRGAKNAEEVAREAGAKKDEAMQRLGEHQAWTEDLQLFFKGNRARDSNSILQGLQGQLVPPVLCLHRLHQGVSGELTRTKRNGTRSTLHTPRGLTRRRTL